jgi:hypothetical protein
VVVDFAPLFPKVVVNFAPLFPKVVLAPPFLKVDKGGKEYKNCFIYIIYTHES